ncbi:MAG TPA: hypothetical protein VLA12_08445 [Planctomycetaceae bacterium]|nr:hypothetical protein [Planctomycetaceae bacterium]
MEPTRSQRFYASGWPEFIWVIGGASIGVAAGLNSTEFRLGLLLEWPTNLWFGLVTIISALVGYFLAIFPGIFVIGPLLDDRSRINGAPFAVGDCVQIISGKHAGQVVKIYSTWQGDLVRVDLGEEAKHSYQDIFGPLQLLRVTVES